MNGVGDLWLKETRSDLQKVTQDGGLIEILSYGNDYYAETRTKSKKSVWIYSKYLKDCLILWRKRNYCNVE